MRDGEAPTHSIIAVHPKHNELIVAAINQLRTSLLLHMPSDHIAMLQEEMIQMNSGKIMELGPFSLFFSVSYPNAPGRTFEMQFGTPPGNIIH